MKYLPAQLQKCFAEYSQENTKTTTTIPSLQHLRAQVQKPEILALVEYSAALEDMKTVWTRDGDGDGDGE